MIKEAKMQLYDQVWLLYVGQAYVLIAGVLLSRGLSVVHSSCTVFADHWDSSEKVLLLLLM